MKNSTKLFNSVETGQFELLDSIDKGSISISYKPRSNGKVKKILIKKLKNQYIIESYENFENDKNDEKLVNLKEFKKNILKRDYFSESLICFISYQILNGLKYIHNNKVVHLDIKPENIVIDEYLNIKLINFSLSSDYSKAKFNKIKIHFVGTSNYIAPEILSHKAIDLKDLNKVDLYSLGVTIFKLAFNSYPYGLKDGDNEENQEYDIILKNIENESVGLADTEVGYSSYFIDFLNRLLEKDIKKRININEALDHYWIKGAKILNDEKENLYDSKKFLENLIYNNLINYNQYIKI